MVLLEDSFWPVACSPFLLPQWCHAESQRKKRRNGRLGSEKNRKSHAENAETQRKMIIVIPAKAGIQERNGKYHAEARRERAGQKLRSCW
jgi:hypothetical protein